MGRGSDAHNFVNQREIIKLESYSITNKKFSGFIRYETSFLFKRGHSIALEITDAYEGCEVFINGVSAGIQIIPPFVYEIAELCISGVNKLSIEIATSLERERGKVKNASPTGITGKVYLWS